MGIFSFFTSSADRRSKAELRYVIDNLEARNAELTKDLHKRDTTVYEQRQTINRQTAKIAELTAAVQHEQEKAQREQSRLREALRDKRRLASALRNDLTAAQGMISALREEISKLRYKQRDNRGRFAKRTIEPKTEDQQSEATATQEQ